MNAPERAPGAVRAALVLAAIAAVAGGGVALVKELSAERIAANERRAREERVAQILPPHAYDNVPAKDRMMVDDALLGATPQPVFRARRGGGPAASVIQVTVDDGYNGRIALLVGVGLDGAVLGVRALRHRETPGLGDGIERARGDWIERFDGLSLAAPPAAWTVRRDGGEVDQLTGATITSRAVIGGVRNALLYFERHRDRVFSPPGEP